MVLAKNGQFAQALKVIDRAVDRAQDSIYLKLERVEILELSGDRQRAAEQLAAVVAGGVPSELQDRVDAMMRRLQGG